ncbi:hypothetical protein RM553_01535 [Zunongwangia sp. F363]|uniref:DUF1440 domain-containing protein n=1 Tax=Autumnicola tepida TaxID=3075595 RepID=A0ABU3C5Q5_9FLAO|nr:hypothetical protein [Zunongwangia sp. F363]MDT0641502.1 hypothetical protein [Zunongwangia sp. F363]
MKSDSKVFSVLANAGGVLGKSLIAGFAGTVAITISQMIEMQITKRNMSNAPVIVGGKTLGVEPRKKAVEEKEKANSQEDKASEKVQQQVAQNKEKFSQIMHFGYGTGWGVFRGALDVAGLRGPIASAAHFGAIWGTAQVMLPTVAGSKPINKWPAGQIAIDVLHHSVYAFAAGAVYDGMRRAESTSSEKKSKFCLSKIFRCS